MRRLALIVGIGVYKDSRLKQLKGAPLDAQHMYDLLTGAGGYGFPRPNVCLLRDAAATVTNFKTAFDQGLIKRAKPNDVVVVYFAGHGSTRKDTNGDEGDGTDETLVFHDSRTQDVHDLLDDEFNTLLAALHQRTQRITVILDSCNSGTAARADAASLTARFQEPETLPTAVLSGSAASQADGSPTFTPMDLPGLVLLAAAADGTSALESPDGGIFTNALMTVLSAAPKPPLSYTQVSYQVRPLVAARSSQVPYFHGDLSGVVFGNEKRSHPMGLRVSAIKLPNLTLSGPPLPGLGLNAELRVFDGQALGPDTLDPKKAKATLIVENSTGLRATGRIIGKGPNLIPIKEGDLAVLIRPADSFLRLSVRLRSPTQPGGIPLQRATAIQEIVDDDPDTKLMVQLVTDETTPVAFELSVQDNNRIVLRDSENRIRNHYQDGDTEAVLIANNLWQHARQLALKHLTGEGGRVFRDGETLQVSLVPESTGQTSCARKATWDQAKPNEPQNIPLCFRYQIKVTLDAQARVPLLVGGAILSSDGGILSFSNMLHEPLYPGRSRIFSTPFHGLPPLDIEDQIMVFGTHVANPIDWGALTSRVADGARTLRDPASTTSGLGHALGRYLVPGMRGQAEVTVVEDSAWTRTSLPVKVRANANFLESPQDGTQQSEINKREYTIANFDIRPYLPDDKKTALYKVLWQADSLAKYSRMEHDGVSYKQHPWIESTDADNLRKGIDCSRAIWFTFTRAGLAYNKQGNAYVSTVDMVKPQGPMADEFLSCPADPQIGDVLVFRDDTRGDGHTVMVIDPVKRIAWGSHGWDGNVKESKMSDTGVEYQLIKYKKDWTRWDRPTMKQKACWRYRQIAAETMTSRGQPSADALNTSCEESQCLEENLPDETFMQAIQEKKP
ncbi:caspase family protein [Nitrospira japonica]|nr:caspase family protein [Nitrospira japonica]